MSDELDERGGLPSASSLDGDIRCLGRRNLMRLAPKKKGTKATERGSKIHAVMEGTMEMEDLSDSEKYTASKMMNEEAKILDELNFHHAQIVREKRMWHVNEEFEKVYSGKIDVVHILERTGVLMDYKNWFKGVVDIEQNWQIRSQAVLVHESFGLTKVHAYLVHPGFRPDEMSQTATFEKDEILAHSEQIDGFIKQMEDPEAPRTPNRISCHYCTAKDLCKEYQEKIAEVKNADGTMKARPRYETYSPKERGDRLHVLKMAANDIKAELEIYKDMLKIDPTAVEGWKLRTDTTRDITDDQGARTLVRQAIGEQVADSCMQFSLTALETYLKGRGIQKKEAKHYVETLLKDVILFGKKEPSLVEK